MHGQAAQFRVRCVQVGLADGATEGETEYESERGGGRALLEGVTTNLYAYGCHGYARSNFNCNFRSSSTSTSNSGCDPTFQYKVAQPRLKDNST